MWAPNYFGCVAPFSDEFTVNPLLFYTHTLALVKYRCCSNVVAEPPWSFTLEKYSGADEVHVNLELKEDLGRPWRPPKMNAGDALNGEKGSSNSSQLSQELTQNISFFCALLYGSPETLVKQKFSPLVCFGFFFWSSQFMAYVNFPLQEKLRSSFSIVTSSHNSEKFPVMI